MSEFDTFVGEVVIAGPPDDGNGHRLAGATRKHPPGERVTVGLYRRDRPGSFPVTLAAPPSGSPPGSR